MNRTSIWLATLGCLLTVTSCKRTPSDETTGKPTPESTTQPNKTIKRLASAKLKESFPLFPLVEPKLWQELLRLEELASKPDADPESLKADQNKIDALAARLQEQHPFSQDELKVSLGKITYYRDSGRIELMAEVNDPDSHQDSREDIEVILCTPKGRTHETLFITEARPLHLEVLLHLTGHKKTSSGEQAPAGFSIQVALPNQAPIPLHDLLSTRDQKPLDKPMRWEFTGSPFQGLYKPDLTGDLIISWHAHDSVLVSANESIASNETRLKAIKHPALTPGIMVKLLLIPKHGQNDATEKMKE